MKKLFRFITKTKKGVMPFALGAIIILLPIVYFSLKNTTSTVEAAWYNTEWQFRKKFTIDSNKVQGASNLTDFTVLVDVVDENLKDHAQSDADDILFTQSNGTTQMDHEIERFDSESGKLVAWVQIPTLSYNSDTEFYMYYGNAAATDQSNAEGTWKAEYEAVWHMNEAADANRLDSTDGNLDLTDQTTVDQTEGLMGYGGDFEDDDDDYLDIGNTAAGALNVGDEDFTISMWIKVESYPGSFGEVLFAKYLTSGNQESYQLHLADYSGGLRNALRTVEDGSTDTVKRNDTFGDLSTETWYYVVGTHDSIADTMCARVNDDSDCRGNSTGVYDSTADVVVGKNPNGTTQNFDGIIDEIRFLSEVPTDDWLDTEYYMISDNDSFYNSVETQEFNEDPTLFWAFNESAGSTANDSSGAKHNGSINGATWETEDMCVNGACLSFDGTSDYVTRSDEDDLDFAASQSFTVQAWFRHSGISVGSDIILTKLESSGTDGGYALSMQSDGDIMFEIEDDDGDTNPENVTTTTANYDDNQWHMATFTKNGTTSMALYIDGLLIDEDTSIAESGTLANGDDLYVGSATDGTSNEWDGLIDEVKIYPYARSLSQIKADFARGATSKGASAVFGSKDTSFLNKGLIGYWKIDETALSTCPGGGDACDSSGNGIEGYVSGVSLAQGRFGGATDHSGSTGNIDFNDTDELETDSFSISIWVNSDGDSDKFIVNKHDWTSGEAGFEVNLIGADDITFEIDDDASSWPEDSVTAVNTTVNDGEWHHIVVVRKSSEYIQLYYDGELQAEDTDISATGSLANNEDYNLGCGKYTASCWNGRLDEVRHYNRALSPSEVKALYNWAPEPLVHYKMDENQGNSTTNDSSGNGHNGTMSGFSESSWVSGKYGSALNFNGSDTYLYTSSNTIFDTDLAYTVSAWIKPAGWGESSYGDIISKVGALDIYLNDSGDKLELCVNSCATTASSANNTITINEWQHVTVTHDGNDVYGFFVNGVNVTSDSTATSSDVNGVVVVGADTAGASSYNFDGRIDDLRIYNYMRTPGQVIEDMNAGHPIGGSPVGSQAAYWSFDNTTGDTAQDLVGDNDGNLAAGSSCPGASDCPTFTPNGKVNGALDFDQNDYIYIDANDALGYATNLYDVSISFWVNVSSDGEGNNGTIWSHDSDTYISVSNESGGVVDLEAAFDLTTSDATLAITDALTIGTWHHVVMTYEDDGDDEITFWVDGINRGTSTNGSGSPGTVGAFRIGADNGFAYQFDGLIDEFKVYSKALTAEEVRIDMNKGSAVTFAVMGDSESSLLADGAADDPDAWWKLDENMGTSSVSDASGNGNTGTLSGSMTEADWVPGKYGGALDLDGTNDYIDTGILSSSYSNWTFSTWFYSHDAGSIPNTSTISQALITQRRTESNPRFLLGLDNNRVAAYWYDTGSNQLEGTTVLQPNTWYYAALTYDGSTIILYLNGVEENRGSESSLATIAADYNHLVGIVNSNILSNPFDGYIDNPKMYDYALTQAQVAYEYNRGKPVGHWKFDECQGTTAYDSSGHGNNGTISAGDASGNNDSAGTCSSGNGDEMWDNGTIGKRNGSLDFDGTNDQVSIADDDIFSFGDGSTDQPFSITTWINADGVSGNDVIVTKRTDITNREWVLALDGSSGVTLELYDESVNTREARDSSAISTGTWHHIAATYDGSGSYTGINMYINGVLNNEGSTDQAYVALENLDSVVSIGVHGNQSTNPFDGQIDDVRIYNYELTQAQIQKIINEGSARFGPDTGSP